MILPLLPLALLLQGAEPPAAAPAATVSILYTNNRQGALDPCG